MTHSQHETVYTINKTLNTTIWMEFVYFQCVMKYLSAHSPWCVHQLPVSFGKSEPQTKTQSWRSCLRVSKGKKTFFIFLFWFFNVNVAWILLPSRSPTREKLLDRITASYKLLSEEYIIRIFFVGNIAVLIEHYLFGLHSCFN